MNKVEQLAMLYNQAHALTTALQTEYKICDVDLMDMDCFRYWNNEECNNERIRIRDRMKRLRDLIRKSKNREHVRWINLNAEIYYEENNYNER